jgi:heme a synthase
MNKNYKSIIIWLLFICFLVLMMVFVGGLTRLTDSGLSMVDWRPLMGTIPPLGNEAWEKVFESYKNYPEYQQINYDMTLSEFKTIFYWEYSHRMLGRFVGLAFFVPWVYFNIRKRVPKNFNRKFLIAFILGGAQGLMGWYMVKSGLVDQPDVSHFRLAAHLLLALFILCYLAWLILSLIKIDKVTQKFKNYVKVKRLSLTISIILFFQILYGAFLAGLKGGLMYNTFPKMQGEWIAKTALDFEPLISNFIHNPVMIQFIHRIMGILLFVLIIYYWFEVKKNKLTVYFSIISNTLIVVTCLQVILGILVLINMVPIALGSMHQMGASLLMIIQLISYYYLYDQRNLTIQR